MYPKAELSIAELERREETKGVIDASVSATAACLKLRAFKYSLAGFARVC